MKLHPWIENNPPLKDWITTITVTAQLLDYKVDYFFSEFQSIFNDTTKRHDPIPGIHNFIEITRPESMANITLAISFSNDTPIRIKIDIFPVYVSNVEYFSNNINDLPKYQKIIEEWIV